MLALRGKAASSNAVAAGCPQVARSGMTANCLWLVGKLAWSRFALDFSDQRQRRQALLRKIGRGEKFGAERPMSEMDRQRERAIERTVTGLGVRRERDVTATGIDRDKGKGR